MEAKRQNFQSIVQNYDGFALYNFQVGHLNLVRDMDVEDGDIFVASYPKSGTTWVQQITSLICNGGNIEEASKKNIDERFPFLELLPEFTKKVLEMPHPRMVKTHLPYHLLPTQLKGGKGKLIYVARNPKDTLVSYYHFSQLLTFVQYQGDFQEFFDEFLCDEANVAYGPWWKHVLDYWQNRSNKNMFFITYEELQKDLPGGVRRLAAFLGVSLSDKQVETISKHCTFASMSKNNKVNYVWAEDIILKAKKGSFMRKGQTGDWKNYFTEEQNKRMDEHVRQKLSSSGLKFVYE